jgi:hypothetical protein
MDARYVFAVRFRLEPSKGVSVDPATFETRLLRPADPPGEPGWYFFRDNLWRGELADPEHFRDLAADALGVQVESVEYRAFETDEEYREALEAGIAADLDSFKADSATDAIHKYLGSSLEVLD